MAAQYINQADLHPNYHFEVHQQDPDKGLLKL